MALGESIPHSLDETTKAIATLLSWPNNLGIEFRPVRLRTRPETALLAVFVRGLVDEESVRLRVMEPLVRASREQPEVVLPQHLDGLLPAPRLRTVQDLSEAVRGILEGCTALFFHETQEAVLVQTEGPATPAGRGVEGFTHKEVFDLDLSRNVALIRQRVRDAALIAEPASLPQERARGAAIIYRKGRADPFVVDQVKVWLRSRAAKEALHRGLAAGVPGMLGMLPDLMSTRWPDNVACLVDAGYVAVLVDRFPYAYVAPVTAPALLLSPGDENLRRPVTSAATVVRLALAMVVMTASAAVVALINYHQEMVPTPFLLIVAGTRESSAFPIVFEVLVLEVLQEVFREAAFRMPLAISPGLALIAGELMVLILVQTSLVGPVPAVVTAVVSIASLSLTSYDAFHLIRVWRFLMIMSAGIFGFLGVAFTAFLLAAYLAQARSFGVPFFGERGFSLTIPARTTSTEGASRDPERFLR